jgi:hypothetical protein
VYAFPQDFQARISRKSLLTRARPLLAKVQDTASYLMRVTFGSALIASVVVVYTALVVVMSSSSSRDDDRRRGGGMGMPVRMMFNATDLLWYWDPYYYRTTRAKIERGALRAAAECLGGLCDVRGLCELHCSLIYMLVESHPEVATLVEAWCMVWRAAVLCSQWGDVSGAQCCAAVAS